MEQGPDDESSTSITRLVNTVPVSLHSLHGVRHGQKSGRANTHRQSLTKNFWGAIIAWGAEGRSRGAIAPPSFCKKNQ